MGNIINLFCCSTKYHILISCLMAFEHRDERNLLVVQHGGFQGKERLKEKYSPSLFDEVYLLNIPKALPHKLDFLFYKQSITKMMEKENPSFKELREAGDKEVHCYLCEDCHHFVRYFIYNFPNIVLLEDGMQIYKPYTRKENLLKKWVKYSVLGIVEPNGRDKRVREIWVQYPERLPADVAEKGKKLCFKEFLTDIARTDYLTTMEAMLGFSDDVLQRVEGVIQRKGDHRLVLMITQPLSEDGLISIDEKRRIYEKMLETVEKPYQLIIKPHPREVTDYSTWFKEAIVLNNGFPLELIQFVCGKEERPIDLAITVDSTAVMNISEVCKHIKMFGLCDITTNLGKKYPLGQGFEE